MISQDLSKC